MKLSASPTAQVLFESRLVDINQAGIADLAKWHSLEDRRMGLVAST
jgi:hypothetical protein